MHFVKSFSCLICQSLDPQLVLCLILYLCSLPPQLDALCPAVDELMKLTTAPLTGQMAVLQAAVQVQNNIRQVPQLLFNL